MEFDEIKAEVKKVEPDTTRMDNENYFEAVIGHTSLEGMVNVLEGIFGAPAWPSKKKLPRDIVKVIDSVGGLRNDQTLYFINKEGCSTFAMLWPWQDGERITIKMSNM
jgi:hypothetical protein